MSIVVSAAIETSQAEAGARRFNAALASMRSGVVSTGAGLATLSRSLLSLPTLIAGAGLTALGKKAIEAGDSFLQLKARLALVTYEGTSVEAVMGGLENAANRARIPVSELTTVYQRNANALKDMKRSQEEGIRLSETLAKVVKISGVDASQASAGMMQLSQAIVSGKFQGDEFRSVAENIPEVLRILQQETGLTAKRLREMAEAGQLTGEVLVNSLLNASQRIDDKFAQMPKTAGESLSQLGDTISREFGKAAELSGVSKAWADAFDLLRDGIGGPGTKDAFKTFADFIASAGRGFADLIRWVSEAKITVQGWVQAIQDTSAYKNLVWVVNQLGEAFQFVATVTGNAGGAFGAIAAAAMPETSAALADVAAKAKKTADELRVVGQLRGSILNEVTPIEATAPVKKLPIKFEESQTSKDLKKLMAVEAMQMQLRRQAMLEAGELESDTTLHLRNQLDIRTKITDEQRKLEPALVKQVEAQIRMSNEMERQSAVFAKNRELGERFAGGLVDAFKSAAESGKSFGQSLRMVLARLIDMTTQALILEPLVKSIGKSFAGSAGSTDVAGSIFGSLMSSIGMGGGTIPSAGGWSTTFTPFAKGGIFDEATPFAYGGGMGVMGEAGPEAVMPLTRGSDGRLGVAASGGGGSHQITFNIQGSPDQSQLAQMEAMARRVVAEAAPGIVRASETRVATRHRADPGFLRR